MKKMLEIITATTPEGGEVPLATIRQEWAAIKAAHEKALEAEPTWAVFGGVLTVNGNTYQVA